MFRDARGVRITSLEFSCYPRGEPREWERFAEMLGCRVKRRLRTSKASWRASFTALPREHAEGELYASGVLHPMADDPTAVHFLISWQAMPSTPPPSDALADSDRVGGLEKFLVQLRKAWPGASSIDGEARLAYSLDPRRWEGLAAMTRIGAEDPTLRLEYVAWRLVPATGVIQRIGQTRPEQPQEPVLVTVWAEVEAEIGPKLVESCDAQIWPNLENMLKPAT